MNEYSSNHDLKIKGNYKKKNKKKIVMINYFC